MVDHAEPIAALPERLLNSEREPIPEEDGRRWRHRRFEQLSPKPLKGATSHSTLRRIFYALTFSVLIFSVLSFFVFTTFGLIPRGSSYQGRCFEFSFRLAQPILFRLPGSAIPSPKVFRCESSRPERSIDLPGARVKLASRLTIVMRVRANPPSHPHEKERSR